MMRDLVRLVIFTIVAVLSVLPSYAQLDELLSYWKQIGLTDQQIASLRGGQPVAVNLHSRSPAEIYVFGSVYINATPEAYVKFAYDFNRLKDQPGYLAIKEFSLP